MLVSLNSFAENEEEIADGWTCVSIPENIVSANIVAYYPTRDMNNKNAMAAHLLFTE